MEPAPGDAIRITTLLGGSLDALTDTSPANETVDVVWDAQSDLAGLGTTAQLRVLIMAKKPLDQLIDLHFVELPVGIPLPGDPVVRITSAPVLDIDLLNAYFWLVGTGDSAITTDSGRVCVSSGCGGTDGILVDGSVITDAGREFIWQRVGVRAATAGEIARAKVGTTPGVQQYEPNRRVGRLPLLVNEVGIDTGTSDGYWVVDLD